MNEEESAAFNHYAREHYQFMITEAFSIVEAVSEIRGESDLQEWARTVFDKIATPRVFLKEQWRDLDAKQRMKHYPDSVLKEAEAQLLKDKADRLLEPPKPGYRTPISEQD